MQTVKEFPYLVIKWDEQCRALVLQWRGGYTGRNLKEGLLAGLAEFKKRRPYAHWIGDTTDIGVISNEEKTWIDQEWFPQFLATGVKYMAVIQPSNVVAKMSVREIMAKVPGTQLTVYNCTTVAEACDWMKQQL